MTVVVVSCMVWGYGVAMVSVWLLCGCCGGERYGVVRSGERYGVAMCL